MTDVLRDEYFVYFAQMKTILTKLKKFRSDGLYPIVDELSDEESAEVRLASYEEASKRDKRFAFLKRPRLIHEAGGMFRVQIYGPKIRQKLSVTSPPLSNQKRDTMNEVNNIIDLPTDFKDNKYAGGYTVVSFTPVRDAHGITNTYDVSCDGKLDGMNEARIRASTKQNSLNFICGIISIVDNRTDPRVDQVEKIVSQCGELAKAILHSGRLADAKFADMDDLVKLSRSIEALTKNLKG
jgi:enamine deaminase RidA (YjgF/YER057c/UK114 family)